MSLRFVSAGAAQGLVESLAREAGIAIAGQFGAVGAMLEKLNGGEPADVVILTRAQVQQLAADGRVVAETVADLGTVATALARRAADPAARIDSGDALAAALLAADTIHFPDPSRATAGIHFAKVIDRLGIREQVAERLRVHPNGMTAMRALAGSPGNPIGCTQATEILATPDARLVGPLPPGFELETLYTAAVATDAADRAASIAFLERLTGAASSQRRDAAGFRQGR